MKKVFLITLSELIVCGYGCLPETFSKNHISKLGDSDFALDEII